MSLAKQSSELQPMETLSKEEQEEARIQAKRKEKHPPSLKWWVFCTIVLYGLAIVTYLVTHKFFPAYNTGKLATAHTHNTVR